MRWRVSITLLVSLAVLFLLLPAAHADSMQLYFTGQTSGGDSVPYLMVLSQPNNPDPSQGIGVWMNCDDHYDTIQGGESWNATVFAGSANDLSSTAMSIKNNWGEVAADQAYDAKAYIELNYSGKLNNPAYSNAIWHIFDNAWGCDAACQVIYNAGVNAAAGDSGNNYLSYRQFLTIYSGPYSNIKNQYGSSPPQEFDLVPDGGMTLMLLGGALVGLGSLRRRFRA